MTRTRSIMTSLLAVAAMLTASQVHASLVAHWKLDDGSGTTAFDEVGATNDAIFGTPAWDNADLPPVPSGTTHALQFDGASYIESTNFAGIGGANDRSVAFWVKLPQDSNTDPANAGLVAWGDSNVNGAKWHVRINNSAANGTLGAIRTEIQGTYLIGSTDLRDGQWHHVVSTFSGDSMLDVKMYIDGVEETYTGDNGDALVNTDIGAGADANVFVGARVQSPNANYFDGKMDDVRIYDHALNQAEIDALALPEPSSLALLTLGGLLIARRRR